MDVIIIKFNNGIELIGTLVSKNELVVTMENIFQLTYRISEHNNPVISMSRYMMASESRQISMPLHEIFSVGVPYKQVMDHYDEACRSFDEDLHPYLSNSETTSDTEKAYLNFLELFPANPNQMQ